MFVDNDRWRDMPFYIRTGKKLGRREMEVAVVFKSPSPDIAPTVLLVKFQPTEGVYLQFNIKRPGDFEDIMPVKMDFCQSCSIANRINTPEAYERLLSACFHGERSWFSQWDQIETSWKYVDRLEELWGDRTPADLRTGYRRAARSRCPAGAGRSPLVPRTRSTVKKIRLAPERERVFLHLF